MILLLELLDLEELTPGWANWLSTHPTPAARLQALQAECGKKP
jgi:Zn-dependent protease with chaperone function